MVKELKALNVGFFFFGGGGLSKIGFTFLP